MRMKSFMNKKPPPNLFNDISTRMKNIFKNINYFPQKTKQNSIFT